MRLRINKRAQFGLVAAASIAATLAAGGLAMAATDTRIASEQLGRFGDADLNNDGKITRPEWLRAAANRFAAIDADHNGSLSQSELPKPPVPPRPGRHHGPDGPPPPGPGADADAEWGPPAAAVAPPAAAVAPAAGSVAAAPVQAAPAAGASVAAPAR